MGQAASPSTKDAFLQDDATAETQLLRSLDGAVEGDGGRRCSAQYDPELARYGGAFDRKFAIGQVTVRLPLDWRPLPLLALALSFLPWLLPLLLLVDFVLTKHFAPLLVLAFLSLVSLVSEFAAKPLLRQPRPASSACRDANGELLPGMPSGHVLISQTFAVCCALEAVLELPGSEAAWQLPLLALFMAGVPWARWYNGDHTFAQVLVGGVAGTCCGGAAYALYYCCAPIAWHGSHGEGPPSGDVSLGALRGSMGPFLH